MERAIYGRLAQVRRRQRRLFVERMASAGLLVGSLVGLALALGRWLAAWPVTPWQPALAFLIGPALGALLGFFWPQRWRAAAAAVDAHYRLKDRAVTALAFLGKTEKTPLDELQVRDAAEHLSRVDARAVLPWRMPKLLPPAVAALALAMALAVWPAGPRAIKAGVSEPLPEVLETVAAIQEDLNQFEELAKEDQNPELEKLVEMLREKVEEMKEPGVDLREALAKLSDMQSAIQAQQAQYNVELVDAQLESLGSGMSLSQALAEAGKSLVEGKFDKAAEELEQLDEPPLDRKEAKAVEEQMKKSAQQMGEVGLGDLADATSEMADGIKGGKGKFQRGSRRLAKEVKGHQRRRKINELLNAELSRLNESKCNCQKNSLARGKKPQKSTSPSQSFGLSTSGNVRGDQTNLLSKKNLEQVSGPVSDDGPSEVETTHSPEGRQQASRGYRDSYQKYRRLSEAVLDSEPIPLGHRQTIRRYFELIRPEQGDLPPAADTK
ncbi:MAG TPA: hypothetical protein VMV10_03035 [Pirellulales bacterium]|nr:hypothetical protein [Pirellulales bacterium]